MYLMTFRRHLLLAAVPCVLIGGCVTEEVEPDQPVSTARPPRLFGFEPAQVYVAGAYHGVNLFFELDPEDVPDAAAWMAEERKPRRHRQGVEVSDRQLPPVIPEIAPGGREIYRIRDIHRVDYEHSMFTVGEHSYVRMPQARLYVFKERSGNFAFTFRGQPIVVPSGRSWTPTVYYYAVEEEGEGGHVVNIEKEVVTVGFASIESIPKEGKWLVNGKAFYPESSRGPLQLDGAVHIAGAR
jgi:hypothetical protein